MTCAPLFVEGRGKGGDCRGREPNVAGFQARRAHDCAPLPQKAKTRANIKKEKNVHGCTPQRKRDCRPLFSPAPENEQSMGVGVHVIFLCKCEGNRVSPALQQSKQSKPHGLRSLSEPSIAERLWLRFSLLWFVTFKRSLMGI